MISSSSSDESSELSESSQSSYSSDNDIAYNVEYVEDYKTVNGKFQYLIKQVGYSELSWIKLKDCNCQYHIDAFWERQAENL